MAEAARRRRGPGASAPEPWRPDPNPTPANKRTHHRRPAALETSEQDAGPTTEALPPPAPVAGVEAASDGAAPPQPGHARVWGGPGLPCESALFGTALAATPSVPAPPRGLGSPALFRAGLRCPGRRRPRLSDAFSGSVASELRHLASPADR